MAKPIPISIPAGLDEAISWLDAARNPDKYAPWLDTIRAMLDELNAAIGAVGKIDEMDAIAARIRAKLTEAEATNARAEKALIDSRKLIEAERINHEKRMKEGNDDLAARRAEFERDRKKENDEISRLRAELAVAQREANETKSAADRKTAEALAIKDEFDRRVAAFKAAAA